MTGPFSEVPPAEEHLDSAPLPSVLAQIRFPKAPVLLSEAGAQRMLDLLRARYPILRTQPQLGLVIGPPGVVTQAAGQQLAFSDRDGAWTVIVNDDAIAVQTRKYDSRQDFCERVDEVFAALAELADPVVFDRLGVRYTNQIDGQLLDRLGEIIKPEMQAGLSVPLDGGIQLSHCISDALFSFSAQEKLRVRWGRVPANAMVDPGIDVRTETSWLLDLDAWTEGQSDFSTESLSELTRRLAERCYRFFHWSVTDEYRRTFR